MDKDFKLGALALLLLIFFWLAIITKIELQRIDTDVKTLCVEANK